MAVCSKTFAWDWGTPVSSSRSPAIFFKTAGTTIFQKPSTIKNLAQIFGNQCVVVAIDVKRNYEKKNDVYLQENEDSVFWFEVYTYGGRKATGLDAIRWAIEAEKLGAGELLITSMDRDGTKDGYDLQLTSKISEKVNVPIIASGGAGNPQRT